MTTTAKSWLESVHLHPDVLKENADTDIFALDLGPLADGAGAVAPVYRDAESFFRASYITAGLKSLLDDVLKRLAGKGGAPVLKLMTPFGGGKSHTMAALFHAASNHKALDVLPEAKGLANPGEVRIAVIDGQFFNAQKGKELDGIVANTFWGWIALKLGGKSAYEAMRANDEARVSPGGDDLLKLFGDKPNLILLDETLEYLINAGGVKVIKSNLQEQTLNFLKELTVAAANSPKTVVVLALPSSQPRETLQHSQLLQTLDHFVGRKDALREPVEQDEVFKVIQRRLLEKMPAESVANAAASAYQELFTQMRKAYASTPAEEQQAAEEGIQLRDRIRAAYPFHPSLIDLMRQRWASLPEYQRTRGALRFLAACLRAHHKAGKSGLVLGPGDVLINDAEVRRACIKELGLMNKFDAVFQADLVGTTSQAAKIDKHRAKANPGEIGKSFATRIANAIFLYSFGGLRRDGDGSKDVLPPGISESDLFAASVSPDLDSLTVTGVLSSLRQSCLYLHFDGVRYCFKQDPNITLLIETEADAVAKDESLVASHIKTMLEERLAGHHAAIAWPEASADVPDEQARFQLAYLSLEFTAKSQKEKESFALDLFEKCGSTPRKYRNGLGLAIPASDQTEGLRTAVRYFIAVERVTKNAKKHNLTKDQADEIKERKATYLSAAESAFVKLYPEVWLPKLEQGSIVIEKIAIGGRPLQTTTNERRLAMVFERSMELITQVQTRVYQSLKAAKLVDLFKLGPATKGVTCAAVVDGIYSYLGYPRLIDRDVVRKTIAKGVLDGVFGYYTGTTPSIDASGKYEVPKEKVSFKAYITEDEVDLDAGLIIDPAAIPDVAPVSVPVSGPSSVDTGDTQPTSTPATGAGQPVTSQSPTALEKKVEISFSANRDQLYTAWNAIANLADMAGKVEVRISAESDKGFEKSKLQNGVIEPLKEQDLI